MILINAFLPYLDIFSYTWKPSIAELFPSNNDEERQKGKKGFGHDDEKNAQFFPPFLIWTPNVDPFPSTRNLRAKRPRPGDEGEKSNKCLREINLNFRMSCQKAKASKTFSSLRCCILRTFSFMNHDLFSQTRRSRSFCDGEKKNCLCGESFAGEIWN